MTTATDLRMVMNTAADPGLPRIRSDLDINDSTLFAVYCFIKNFIGAASTNAVAIDNKIEQAMDLVKSHLMFAVREEVEVLKERIAELMDRINQLETENSILKAHASQEVLAQLQIPPVTPSYMQPNVMPVVVSAGAAVAAVAAVAVSAAQVVSVPSPGQAPPTN